MIFSSCTLLNPFFLLLRRLGADSMRKTRAKQKARRARRGFRRRRLHDGFQKIFWKKGGKGRKHEEKGRNGENAETERTRTMRISVGKYVYFSRQKQASKTHAHFPSRHLDTLAAPHKPRLFSCRQLPQQKPPPCLMDDGFLRASFFSAAFCASFRFRLTKFLAVHLVAAFRVPP